MACIQSSDNSTVLVKGHRFFKVEYSGDITPRFSTEETNFGDLTPRSSPRSTCSRSTAESSSESPTRRVSEELVPVGLDEARACGASPRKQGHRVSGPTSKQSLSKLSQDLDASVHGLLQDRPRIRDVEQLRLGHVECSFSNSVECGRIGAGVVAALARVEKAETQLLLKKEFGGQNNLYSSTDTAALRRRSEKAQHLKDGKTPRQCLQEKLAVLDRDVLKPNPEARPCGFKEQEEAASLSHLKSDLQQQLAALDFSNLCQK